VRKKNKPIEALKAPVYVIKFFDSDWNCRDDLTMKGSVSDVFTSIALWLKSREGDEHDVNLVVFSCYHNIVFVSVEEDDHEAK
jgi:hypothetical protein